MDTTTYVTPAGLKPGSTALSLMQAGKTNWIAAQKRCRLTG